MTQTVRSLLGDGEPNIGSISFTLAYSGHSSELHEIDLYDVSEALVGFQRSLALTTHLILNNEIITQSPSLKGASIFVLPPEDGSWKITAKIVVFGTCFYHLSTAPKETPLGHLVYSAYDYVVSETLGIHVDYQKSLGQLYEEAELKKQKVPEIKEHQLDSLIEKCEKAISDIHRPIYKTHTAEIAQISAVVHGKKRGVGPVFSSDTYLYLSKTIFESEPEIIKGRISSYNTNTYKGRIFDTREGRPIPFELMTNARTEPTIEVIVESLSYNALQKVDEELGFIYCRVLKYRSKSGHLKSYLISNVSRVAPTS
jgi:hypothetical protein